MKEGNLQARPGRPADCIEMLFDGWLPHVSPDVAIEEVRGALARLPHGTVERRADLTTGLPKVHTPEGDRDDLWRAPGQVRSEAVDVSEVE